MYTRTIKTHVVSKLGNGKAVIIYGPRRVGKTTLVKDLLKSYPESERLYLDCDFEDVRDALAPKSLTYLESTIGQATCVVIDEAQRVPNIGLTIKILVDNRPDIQVIATGSSSFDLANRIKEPLTGRAFSFNLYPLSVAELGVKNALDLKSRLESLLVFGSYPLVVGQGNSDARAELGTVAESYILKDVAELADLRQREILPKLLTTLALQIGGEVSYHEIAGLLGVSPQTIERYIVLLEDAFIVYRLDALLGNQRNVLSNRKRKVYFYDLGIRNALIGNFNALELRGDVGQLWENFCVNERIKSTAYDNAPKRFYWRGVYGEVDLVEERAGVFSAAEFTYTSEKVRTPKYFAEGYPEAALKVVGRDSLVKWLIDSNT